jgi:NADPH2:quinone reductase
MEAAGIVLETGPGVERYKTGDRVMGFFQKGGYAEAAVLSEASTLPVPAFLDFAAGTALMAQGLTAYFLLKEAPLSPGENILIVAAAGGVGSLAVQMARLLGAGTVVGLASPAKHETVRRLGAVPIDYTQPGWSRLVSEATAGQGIHVYLDPSGDTAGEGFETLAPKARWIVFGGMSGMAPLPPERLGRMIFQGITLKGYSLYNSVADSAAMQEAVAQVFGWAQAGALTIDTSNRFPLSQAREAHEAVAARKTTGKVVLEP